MADTKVISGEIKSAHGKPLRFYAKTSEKLREYLKTAKSIPYSVTITPYESREDVEARRKATKKNAGGWPTDAEILRMLVNEQAAAARTAEVADKHEEYGIKKPEMKNDRLQQFRSMRAVFETLPGVDRAEATKRTEAAIGFTEAEAIADADESDDDSDEAAE